MLARTLSVVCLLSFLILVGMWEDYQAFLIRPLTEKAHTIEIAKGSAFNKIAPQLQQENIRINPLWFKALGYQKGVINSVKAGEYTLESGVTPADFLQQLTQGKVKQHNITFPEGLNFQEIRQILVKNPFIQQTFPAELSATQVLQQLALPISHPEGWFFPDTYRFTKGTKDSVILLRAFKKMQTVLAAQWQQKSDALPLKTAYDALILASIVEKETAVGSERALIAGVFTQRLKIGMRLQTDPTVIYGMGANYQGNIRRQDLQTVTPYNTYKIQGLPPTPIAMPGKAAIYAALHPAKTNSLYFVANGDGSHIFSATLRAHNNAVNHYQRKLR